MAAGLPGEGLESNELSRPAWMGTRFCKFSIEDDIVYML
jgi:hypothetical protein